ncbi:uncharacterized protein LOC133928946 isoform X2 [Phragmites australis]|uniref:uncharacterized protein LOC133928946 isoform X2 n=1 Tax=Phragmites australis TaxID=29695 RepID=UPI002D7A22B7|nr:uncharacterized protein LOC133928946 isoform X2 [Phragmites australis]
MRAGRSAGVEPSTPVVGGTRWKGRLRSHHVTPQSLPMRRLPSRAKNREESEEAQTSKKQATSKNTGRGHHTGAMRLPTGLPRQSLRLAGRDPEHSIVIDKECKARDSQSAIKPLRRSPRFHLDDKSLGKPLLLPDPQEIVHNRKTQNALRIDKNQENVKRNKRNAGVRPLARMKSRKETQALCQDPQDIPPRNKTADVSRKKSEKQELKPSHCEVLTGKRKRGTEGRSSSKRQRYQEPKSSPPDCQEIAPSDEPRKTIHRKIKKDPSIMVQPKSGDDRLINADENNKVASGIEKEGMEHFCGSDDWTEEQDLALRKSYFTARPSPHFWKRVSKMVPGRSAEECFNRIHADLSTPTPIAPRPRTSKTTFSPLGKFTLSDAKLPNLLKPTVRRQRTAKQKSLAAQKTVRHLLQKHCLIDQAQEADHFSIFETSPNALQLNIPFEDSPGTPDSYINSGSVHKCSGSSSARKKPFSRLRTKQAEPSPAVLKPVKNVVLHEKYIDQLSRREGTKRPRKRTPSSKAADSGKTFSEQQAGGLKAAKNALISEATDFISRFKKLQANSLAHVVENSEDDDIDGIECGASDYCHDDKE